MNEHIASIVCPNCGASSTNHNKCDFCGSVLVRFADKNVQHLEEKFGKSVRSIPGLDVALEENLSLQESSGNDSIIITRIFPSEEDRNDVAANNAAWETVRTYHNWRVNRQGKYPGDVPKRNFYMTPKGKTAFGTDYYEIISSKDSLFGSDKSSIINQDYGLTLRFPFSKKNIVLIHEYSVYENKPFVSKSNDFDFSEPEKEFREHIDFDGLFRPFKYNNGMFYLLDLGQDIESASRIATYYVGLVDKGGFWKGTEISWMKYCNHPYQGRLTNYERNVFTFDIETLVLNKNDIILDPTTGNIIRKSEIKPVVQEREKSFWEKLFG